MIFDDNPHASIRILRTRMPYAPFDMRPWSPAMNIFETDESMLLVVELAGVEPANVQIEAPFDRPIDPDRTTARFNNGLLEIWLPFAGRGTRQIVIHVRQEGEP